MGAPERCIRCRENLAVDKLGYCGPCHWVSKTEVERGIAELRKYLLGWDDFSVYCLTHGLPNPTG